MTVQTFGWMIKMRNIFRISCFLVISINHLNNDSLYNNVESTKSLALALSTSALDWIWLSLRLKSNEIEGKLMKF